MVTVRCGAHRVTYLPLATVIVRPGTEVGRGAAIGTVAAGHGGLHVGARRAGERFGYEDPLSFMAHGDVPPVTAAPARRPPARPVGARPRLRPAPPAAVRPRTPVLAPRLERPGVRVTVPRGAVRPESPGAVGSRTPGAVGSGAPGAVGPATPGAVGPGTPVAVRPRANGRPPVAVPGLARPAVSRASPGTAPWIVWVGLALLLAGAVGSCTLAIRRRRADTALAAARTSA